MDLKGIKGGQGGACFVLVCFRSSCYIWILEQFAMFSYSEYMPHPEMFPKVIFSAFHPGFFLSRKRCGVMQGAVILFYFIFFFKGFFVIKVIFLSFSEELWKPFLLRALPAWTMHVSRVGTGLPQTKADFQWKNRISGSQGREIWEKGFARSVTLKLSFPCLKLT